MRSGSARERDAIGLIAMSIIPAIATAPPQKQSVVLGNPHGTTPARLRPRVRIHRPNATIAHRANVATSCAAVRSVTASRTFENGATMSYASDVRRLSLAADP